jgi:hypothetical protein
MNSLKNILVESFDSQESAMINEGSEELQIAKIAKTKNKRQELGITYMKLYRDINTSEIKAQDLKKLLKRHVKGAGQKTQQTMYDLMEVDLLKRVKRGVYKIEKANFLNDLEKVCNSNVERPVIANVDYDRKDMNDVIKRTKDLPLFKGLKTLTGVGMTDRYLAFQLDGVWFQHPWKIYNEASFNDILSSMDPSKIDEVIDHVEMIESSYLSYLYSK